MRTVFAGWSGRWSLAAAVACVALAWPLVHLFSPGDSVFATATGQQQSVKLDDGSVVHLNTESRIQVEFSGQERAIHLLAGEALFDVQREPARPFQVHVGKTLIRALGTQFNIDRHASGVTVSVLEGRVEVLNDAGNRRIIGAGQEVRIGERGIIEDHAAPNIKRRVAWRERRLEFQDDPLSRVVAEFNRYNRARRLRIEGAAVSSRTYTGILSADDPDSLAQVLAEEPGLVVERTDEEILIRAR